MSLSAALLRTNGRGARLIVTADDFGISPGVNRGVVEAHRRGIVSEASLMANQPFAAAAVDAWRRCPGLGLGLHLTLTAGGPVSAPEDVPSLVGRDGRFPLLGGLLARLAAGAVRPDDLRREIRAQVERALALGARLDHLDGHHHVHIEPHVGRIALVVARDYGIRAIRCPLDRPRRGTVRDLARALVITTRARWLRAVIRVEGLRTADHFRGLTLGYGFGAPALATALTRLPAGATELMTHPGYPDAELAVATTFTAGRERELAALTADAARAVLRASGARLARWPDIPPAGAASG